jgi:hypothetical protein
MTRRRLTLDEAQRGVQPDPMTAAEWREMHTASAAETTAKIERVVLACLGRVVSSHLKAWP